MHKNEAIAQVAQQAMEQIFDIAQYAISQIADTGAEIDLAALSQEYTSATVVPDKAEKPRAERKPRTPKAVEAVKEIEPEPSSENDFVDEQKEIEPEPEDAKEVEDESPTTEDATEQDDNEEFPNHPDDWFAGDVERARNLCRALLAKMMAKIGPNETRKNLTETTGKSRATDFSGEDCLKFYRKFRNNV